ncbi:MAG TPA: hypothetical protein VJ696_05920 [Rhodanobacteraceae bacterium]|nr:hypothetical protein [Rhodanobacteraceae bacterium]
MIALPALIELLARLGAELDFDVAKDVAGRRGRVDVVWFDRSLPIAAVASDPLDLSEAPVLPVVAFAARTSADFEGEGLDRVVGTIEDTGARLRIVVIGRDSRQASLAPLLQSVDQLYRDNDDAVLRERIAPLLGARLAMPGRTIVMLQSELVEWARRLREVRPRSYSAETLFNRTGAID